jgi:hypothetical protein
MPKKNKLITGLVPEYVENGIAILQYANDTILCIQDNKEQATSLKFLLYLYESMSDLKINFNKSEAIMVSHDMNKAAEYADAFNCGIGNWPIKYLGVPGSGSKLHIADWIPLTEKILKRLDGWQGSSLSIVGRTILLNSCLSSMPTYVMSMYLLPQTIIEKINKVRKRVFRKGVVLKENIT